MRDLKLGDTARDTVTGFEGIVVCELQWFDGTRALTLQPEGLTSEGLPVEQREFWDGRLVQAGNGSRGTCGFRAEGADA